MMKLNRFLRGCLNKGIDFSRIQFVRREEYSIWIKYFKKDVPVKFRSLGDNTFAVSGTGNRWKCNLNSGDCEILSVTLSRKGVLVTLGDGSY